MLSLIILLTIISLFFIILLLNKDFSDAKSQNQRILAIFIGIFMMIYGIWAEMNLKFKILIFYGGILTFMYNTYNFIFCCS